MPTGAEIKADAEFANTCKTNPIKHKATTSNTTYLTFFNSDKSL